MKLIILFVIIAAIVLLVLLYSLLSRRRHSNVVSLHKKKKLKDANGQTCSRCKKLQPLTFYANDAGIVRGLCKECKRTAEKHEELYPV
ncbi:hypothetical protein SAMN05661091_4631 [Paenibacillus uliginis N3/975]|uniref:Uncharacterized protein n=1 Tax=Paenibacillus uliginis N3/975 TaxID=1313296 RepID=A0A1X7HNJ4_9BACL|nr:hypothetical protein [Paenibacillus uliginis]SMF89393.1 hypothetical protein SAMN05661091_4631 [Paenibacillus uliginis N3/975]